MNVVHLTHELNSDFLQLPEVRPLIGKRVEITIRELPQQGAREGWLPLLELSGQDLIDPDAYKELRSLDIDPWRELDRDSEP